MDSAGGIKEGGEEGKKKKVREKGRRKSVEKKENGTRKAK
jgi:hypothetical protein